MLNNLVLLPNYQLLFLRRPGGLQNIAVSICVSVCLITYLNYNSHFSRVYKIFYKCYM